MPYHAASQQDGLKVHWEGSVDIQPLLQDEPKTPRAAGRITGTKWSAALSLSLSRQTLKTPREYPIPSPFEGQPIT